MENEMIVNILLHWLIVLLLAPILPGIVSRVKAFAGGKAGPSVFQPYYDLVRLFRKQCIYGRQVSWVFRLGPVVVFASMLIVSLIVPLGMFGAPLQFSGDILLLAYLLALARFFMIAAALDTGVSLEGMGASREAFFSCLSEVALFMNFITLVLMTHSYSLSPMIGAGGFGIWQEPGPEFLLVVVSLFLVLLAENCRIPVDDPDTHLELTMIHEVMILEHSGVDLAYMLYASMIKLFVFTALLIPIIFPYSSPVSAVNWLIFPAGIIGVALVLGILESSRARLRLNRVRNLLLIAFSLAFFALIVVLWRG